MLRLFVAVEIPEHIRLEMQRVIEELKATRTDVRWESVEKLHITLKFLGCTREEQMAAVIRDLEAIALRATSFDVRYTSLGKFPPKGQPRVIWIGVREGEEELTSLATSVDASMTRLGFASEDRAFHPHVTIGRVKGSRNIPLLLRTMESLTFESQPTRVTQFSLIRSELKPSGSVYTTLNRFQLHGAA